MMASCDGEEVEIRRCPDVREYAGVRGVMEQLPERAVKYAMHAAEFPV